MNNSVYFALLCVAVKSLVHLLTKMYEENFKNEEKTLAVKINNMIEYQKISCLHAMHNTNELQKNRTCEF